MHLLTGLLNLLIAKVLLFFYRGLPLDFIGRLAIRRCCVAMTAGFGLDEAVVHLVMGTGSTGVRLLEQEAQRNGRESTASFLLRVIGKSKAP